MITSKNILLNLESDKLSIEQKEALSRKKEKALNKAISSLSVKRIIYYLFESNLPKSVKKIISDKVDELGKDYNDKNLKKIKEIFEQSNLFKSEYLYKNYYPKELKKVIVENIYQDNVIELIIKKSIPFEIIKIIIDVKLSDYQLIDLLKANIDKKTRDYITTNGFKTAYGIYCALCNDEINQLDKEKIIINRINSKNLFDVLDNKNLKPYTRQNILDKKSKEIESFIESLNENNILNKINDYRIPEEIVRKIFLTKIGIINSSIKRLKIYEIRLFIKTAKNQELIRSIIEKNRIKSRLAIRTLSDYETLVVLNRKYIPKELKNFIIEKKSKAIKRQIEKLNYSSIKYTYLAESSHLPLSIQKEIIKQKESLFEKEIKKDNAYTLINELLFGSSGTEAKRLMIRLGINKNNIFKTLYECRSNNNAINLILDEKKELIENYLNHLNVLDLLTLKSIKDQNIKDEIVIRNYDKIFERLKKEKKDMLYKYIDNEDISENMKTIIIELNGIEKDNLENFKQLIKYNDSKKVLKYFESIKDFIIKNNINFESFIQYGSGTNTYEDWIDNITRIIKSKKIDDFINVNKYLLENYYEDNQEENSVQRINNFLQTLSNFNTNYKLLSSLPKINRRLNDKEKENLYFMFNTKEKDKFTVDSLDEIDKYRNRLYDSYKHIVNTKDVTVEELKEIYNKFVFSKSTISLENIGGTRSLIALKEQNHNSKSFCDLIDVLIHYSKAIEKVNYSNSVEGLRSGLKYLLNNKEALNKIQNSCSDIERKIRKLFELDSMINLTKLSSVEEDVILNKELSDRYGGKVFDFSDKNYVLYGHVLSSNENINDLVEGKSNGKNNFISVSPISYRKQKYYYDRYSSIIAFDTIPKGSFVCSSINNMGSNYSISGNSSEVKEIARDQRGILETSVAGKSNSEVLLYREGLIPCGIILPNGKEPNALELEYHKKYNLPFIITQKKNTTIENPKNIFGQNNDIAVNIDENKAINTLEKISNLSIIEKENEKYTGREIAIITDCHSMYEPTLAVLESIRRNGITEIYSLGDNVGFGPNPAEIVDMLEDYKVKSVAGNSEYYNILGTKIFPYLDKERLENQEWTKDKLGSSRIEKLKLYKPSIDLDLGNKKIALCHFANDVRWDFTKNSTWTYQSNFIPGESSRQFLYTNSKEANERIENYIKHNRIFTSVKEKPLFEGKKITDYDAVFQGHVHFEMNDCLNDTEIHTLRALGMGNKDGEKGACYYTLKERKDGGFDIFRRLVNFNKRDLVSNIKSSSIPHKQKVLSFFN